MSKGLEALEKLRQILSYEMDAINFMNEVETIEKDLKALEIIKHSEVDVYLLFKTDDFNEYNWAMAINKGDSSRMLTKEKYNLLKEVFL